MGFVLKYVTASGQKIALTDARRPVQPFSSEVYPPGPSGQGWGPHMTEGGDASGQGIYWSPEAGPEPSNPLGLRVFPSHVGGVFVGPGSDAYQAWARECQSLTIVDAAQVRGQSLEEFLTRTNRLPSDAATLAAIRQIPTVEATPAPEGSGDTGTDTGPYAVGGPGGVGYVGTLGGAPAEPQRNPFIEAIARSMGLTYEQYMAQYGSATPGAPASAEPAPQGNEYARGYAQGVADERARVLALAAELRVEITSGR